MTNMTEQNKKMLFFTFTRSSSLTGSTPGRNRNQMIIFSQKKKKKKYTLYQPECNISAGGIEQGVSTEGRWREVIGNVLLPVLSD